MLNCKIFFYLLFISIFLFSISCKTQNSNQVNSDSKIDNSHLLDSLIIDDKDTTIYLITQQKPTLLNCAHLNDEVLQKNCSDKQLVRTVMNNLKFNSNAIEDGIRFDFYLRFVIEKDGIPSHIEYVKNKEIKSYSNIDSIIYTTRWRPAIHHDKAVRCRMNLPIKITPSID